MKKLGHALVVLLTTTAKCLTLLVQLVSAVAVLLLTVVSAATTALKARRAPLRAVGRSKSVSGGLPAESPITSSSSITSSFAPSRIVATDVRSDSKGKANAVSSGLLGLGFRAPNVHKFVGGYSNWEKPTADIIKDGLHHLAS